MANTKILDVPSPSKLEKMPLNNDLSFAPKAMGGDSIQASKKFNLNEISDGDLDSEIIENN